jgi:beta-glucanase (GH16 family)
VQARTDVVAELQRLAPQHLVILGGSSAVTQVQTNQLGSFSAQPVVRLSGTDRTLTSVAVSSAAFSSASTVYLATGANFPDALAGGSPASAAGAPILLVQPTCIPAAVDAEIDRLGAQTIQVLGGEAALSAAVTQRTVCGAGASEATPPPSGPCGSTVYKAGGSAWQCSFADEFSGSTLDTSHWVVQTTAQSGFHNGPECFVNTPDNLSVGGGTLSLTVRKEAAPFTCAAASAGSYTSQYTSGMVMTAGLFSQTYGRFEVRAKLPAAKVKGLQESFWLWPDNPYKYGTAWPRSGEIDIAEIYHLYPDRAIPYVHYVPGVADPNVTNNYCLIDDVTKFHTYTAEWTPTTITIKYDGVTCLVDTLVAAAPLLVGQPFDQPFMVALTQALGIGSNAFDANTPLPATTQVDYVRIWK